MLREKIFKELDEHFVKDMLMTREPILNENERHYNDEHLYMIFICSEEGVLRILIRNWRTNHSFSKNVVIDINVIFELSKKNLVSFIKETVYQNSGIESRDMLNDWYEIKKVEIRDKKISDLGI
jgi:hypothetical protein